MSDDIDNFMPDLEAAVGPYVLELGPGKGNGSTLAFHRGLSKLSNPLHISVDHQDYMEWKPDVPWWHFVLGDSRAAATLDKVRAITTAHPDLIFIDTNHYYEHMREELKVWVELAGPNTLWLFHDTYMYGKRNHMIDAILEFTQARPEWVYDDFRTEEHGLGRMRRMNYLNLGSGQRPFAPPWLNYDIQVDKWRPPTEEKGCLWVDDPWGLRYKVICLHHVLEHFGLGDADGLIQKCYDHLDEDGSLIITVPNLRALAKRWLVGQLTTELYMFNLYGAYMEDEADRHKWGYDFDYLYNYLKKFPFSVVTEFNWRQIHGDDIAKDWWILGMEAVK